MSDPGSCYCVSARDALAETVRRDAVTQDTIGRSDRPALGAV